MVSHHQNKRANHDMVGGASGIGLEISRTLARKWSGIKTHISIFDINAPQGEKVLESLQEEFVSTKNTSFSFHHCDVTSWESQAKAFAEVVAQQGRVDIVCANAGVAEKGAFLEPSEQPTKPKMLSCDVNFYGVLYSRSRSVAIVSD
jgi:NAD(P)-dependent dehydrogenase (short-subunit alcohol dehydrogenase family)